MIGVATRMLQIIIDQHLFWRAKKFGMESSFWITSLARTLSGKATYRR